MISRRSFLKKLGQLTIIAALSPKVLAEMVDPRTPTGIIERTLALVEGGPLILPRDEFNQLLDALEAQVRYTGHHMPGGFRNVFINGVPVYCEGPEEYK